MSELTAAYPQYPANLQLSSTFAEQVAQDWTTATADPNMLNSLYDPRLDMIPVPYYDYSTLPGTPAPYDCYAGPFLSGEQPLSPVEPWTTQEEPLRPVQEEASRQVSSAATTQVIPRHISSSAFPVSASAESGWVDRSVSFSAFGSGLGDDLWGEEEKPDTNTPDVGSRAGPPRNVRRGRMVGAQYEQAGAS
jgi:hypothetical protein